MSNPGAAVTIPQLTGAVAYSTLARLRAGAPIAWVPALDGWLVTSHEAATAVMRDGDRFTVDHPNFSTARVVGRSMLSTDGAEHARHRRPFAHAFRARTLADRFERRTSELARELVERIHEDGHADLRTSLAGPLSVAVVAAALGLGTGDAPTVLGWYRAIVGAVTDITAGVEPGPGADEAMAELDAAVRAVEDRTTLLAAARASLGDAEVTANAAVLMFGGIETTEAMIATALVHLLERPETCRAVHADRSLLPAVVEESLRLEPAAAAVDRYAASDVELAGAGIRRGDLVRVSLTAANRDPAVFPDPDTFDPTRANLDAQVAFARGAHICPAMDLARLETRVAVEAVLDGLPGVRLDDRPAVTGLVFRKPDAVSVRWDR